MNHDCFVNDTQIVSVFKESGGDESGCSVVICGLILSCSHDSNEGTKVPLHSVTN